MRKYEDVEINDDLSDIRNIENLAEIEKENVDSISKELEHVQCPKCGYIETYIENIDKIKKIVKNQEDGNEKENFDN